jgi:phage protein, HK97 gp10 family
MKGQNAISVSSSHKSGGKNHAEGVSLSFEGFDETVKAFNALNNEDLIFRLSEPSVKGAEIIADKARSKINNITGDLARSIKVHKPGRKKGKAYQIFARVGFNQKGTDGGYYGAARELGHQIVEKNGRIAGEVSEHPFLRPAADESQEEVANIIVDAMIQIITEEWNK